MSSPKVSVCIITYNHGEYISQCLESVLSQQTDFDFEIIVGDDFSIDNTREILLDYKKKYPSLVKLIFQEKNTGGTRNYLDVHEAALGQYVAHLDGDDLMLPSKLQFQSDCLDSNSDVSFAVHAVRYIGKNGVKSTEQEYPVKGTILDLLKLGAYFVHSSVMYRKKYEFAHPTNVDLVDYYFYIERATKGNIYLDKNVLGCYRIHGQGLSKNAESRARVEKCYETAFDRAIELGVPLREVQQARMWRRMAFAYRRFLDGDIRGFKQKVKLEKADMKFASLQHKILHYLRFFPAVVGLYARYKGAL